MRWETKLAIWNSSRIVRTTHLVERTHTCFWQIKGVNFQFRMVTSETKNHIMHPFALLLFDWLMAVTLHCSLPLLATDQNAKLTDAEIRETDYTNVASQHVFPHSNRKFSFYLPLSLAPFNSFWRRFFSFLRKFPPENRYYSTFMVPFLFTFCFQYFGQP